MQGHRGGKAHLGLTPMVLLVADNGPGLGTAISGRENACATRRESYSLTNTLAGSSIRDGGFPLDV